MLEDVARGEAAEKELDAFIERRALKMNPEQHRIEELWRASERAHGEKTRRENRALWYAHEMHLCELHEGLAREHPSALAAHTPQELPERLPVDHRVLLDQPQASAPSKRSSSM